MVVISQIVANALLLSALYALVAIGFTMIFGIADVLNIAHGAAIILGGFSAFYTVRLAGLNIWFGAVAAVVVAALFSLIVYKVFVKPVEDDDIFVIIITLVILLFVEHLFRNLAGTEPSVIPQLVPGNTEILGITAQNNRIFLFVVSWISILGIFYFVKRTWIGRGIEGLSMTPRGSALVGVDRERSTTWTYVIAGGLAGLAGLFFGMSQGVNYNMGLEPLLIAFAIVIIGGMGSIKGSVVGAHIVGGLETLTVTLIDSRLTGVVALSMMVVVILIRPQGLYGRPEE